MRGWSKAERALLAVIAGALGLRVVVALSTELYFDEAYYWVWSRHLAPGYFDHAPLIAWTIALLGVRPTALLCGALTVLAVYGLARAVHGGREAGLRAAAVWCTVPVGALAGIFATPDSPLLLFWTLSLAALWKERWGTLGLVGGLALLSKYTAGLMGPVHLVHAALRRRLPAGSAVSAAVALVCFLPPLIWNARHGWSGFRFQLHHGLGGGGGLRTLGELVLGQLALGGPVVAVFGAIWSVTGPREQRLLRLSTGIPFLLFTLASLRARGEANWAAMAYPAVAIALGGARPRLANAAIVTGLAIIGLGTAQLVRPFVGGAAMTPVARTQGWSTLSRLRAEGFHVVLAPSYQLASEVAYYARLPVTVAGPARESQFDFWPVPDLPEDGSLAFVSEGAEPPEGLERRYALEGPALWPVEHGGRPVHTFHVWRLTPRPVAAAR